MASLEDILVDVRTGLYACSEDILVNAVERLVGGEIGNKDRKQLIRQMEEYIQTAESDEDGGRRKLVELVTLMKPNVTPSPVSSSSSGTMAVEVGKLVGFRKDFKLSGSIGDSAGISYLSFIRQVEAGRRKGYKDEEIVDGVVRAVPTNVRLRSYLEGRDDLTFPKLQAVIRSFYQEKTATELYHELCSLSQGTKETPQDFLFRALALRQKILFASKEDPSLAYDPKLVEGQFKHACITGLCNDIIRMEFRELLKGYESEEKLIEGLNEITRRQTEVERKSHGKSTVTVNAVTSDGNHELLEEIRALRLEVKNIQQQQQQQQNQRSTCDDSAQSGKESNRSAKRSRGQCQKCREKNDPNNRCTHCFICGGSHLKWNCPERGNSTSGKQQGNGQGPSA